MHLPGYASETAINTTYIAEVSWVDELCVGNGTAPPNDSEELLLVECRLGSREWRLENQYDLH